jgi:hypothetical protein
MADDASDVATRKVTHHALRPAARTARELKGRGWGRAQVKQLILLVDKMEQAQVALDEKLKATEVPARSDPHAFGRVLSFQQVPHCPGSPVVHRTS